MLQDGERHPVTRARDLTEITVRGFFYKAFVEMTSVVNGVTRALPENAEFLRILEKKKTDLLIAQVNVAGPNLYSALTQPLSAQRISFLVSAISVPGSITITGKDLAGEALVETVLITTAETLFSVDAFSEIDEDGISMTGSFTVGLYVHDGRVDLIWADGDTDVPGDYFVLLELVHPTGEKETAHTPVEVQILEKIQHPIPAVTSVVTSPFDPGDLATFAGTGFLDATGADFLNLDTASVIALTSVTIGSDVLLEANLPAGMDGGRYGARVTTPGGPSETYSEVVVLPIVNDFSPTTIAPGATLTVDGDGFTGATAIEIVDEEGVVFVLDNLVEVSDDQLTGDIPVAATVGVYSVRVLVPGNQSTLVGELNIQ
jgi:hypothetical protein